MTADAPLSEFGEKLASLCSLEMIAARGTGDAQRLAEMIERLTHSLGWTIAIVSAGDAEQAQGWLTGVETQLYQVATGMEPAGRLARQ